MPVSGTLLVPLEGETPSGASVRYEPAYDRIKDARRDDPLQDPPVKADWALVEKLATEVLSKRAKDLWVAAWLTEALLERQGIGGLRDGLDLIQGLLENFWDDIHPLIDDGDLELRAAPISWVGAYLDVPVRLAPLNAKGHDYQTYRDSRSVPTQDEAEADADKSARREAALAEGKMDPETFDAAFATTPKAWYKEVVTALAESLGRLGTLGALCDERFGSDAPGFYKLRQSLEEFQVAARALLDRKLEADPDPIAAVPDGESTGGSPDGGPFSTSSAGDAGGQTPEPVSRDDAARRISAAARYLRKQTPTDPAPYLLLRGFRWGELRAGGGTIDPHLLAAPPTELRTRLKTLLLKEHWAELLEAAEEVMATPFGRGWLDLQRYILTALEGLGRDYAVVADATRGALRSLLRDLPGLADATLMDDSATANRETLGWLRGQGILGGGAIEDEEDVTASAPTTSSALDSVERILQRLGTRDPQRAIELLTRAAEQEKSERARFLRKVEAARVMVDAGLEAVAMPILSQAVERIERHQLEDWESGSTVAGALGLLYLCMTRLDVDEAEREALYLRVCRLDPLQAIEFGPRGNAVAEPDDG